MSDYLSRTTFQSCQKFIWVPERKDERRARASRLSPINQCLEINMPKFT